jgi:hypothetical protein
MQVRRRFVMLGIAVMAVLAGVVPASAAAHKVHTVFLGAAKRVPYSKAGDPAGAATGEDALKIRALLVDGVLKEWTTGDAHDVTDRSFVVRRVIRLNDELPGDKPGHWVWQRGPWLLVDRVTGHVTVLAKKLAVFDAENHADPVCGAAEWQREPLKITFRPAGKDGVSFDVVPGSAVLVEETGDDPETPAAEAKPAQ